MAVWVNRRERARAEPGPLVRGDVLQREAANLTELERLGHPQRAVGEIRVRRDQLDARPLFSECPEREQRLDAGHTPACDEHARALPHSPLLGWHQSRP